MKKMRVDELVFVWKNILLSNADESLIKGFYNSMWIVHQHSNHYIEKYKGGLNKQLQSLL